MRFFGETEVGETVYRVKLESDDLTLNVITFGASIQDLRLEGYNRPLVLGFDNFQDYQSYSPFFGATVGRVINRIKNGQIVVQGDHLQVERNLENTHMLHGGSQGIGVRNWQIVEQTLTSVKLAIRDQDGWMGFPGNCDITCTYELLPNATLAITLEAESDAPTVCNLGNHSYFNLDDSDTILDHQVAIHADQYLPLNDDLVPTGELTSVSGTALDFREVRPIRQDHNGEQFVYDLNYCLSEQQTDLREIAVVKSLISGVEMKVATTEAGVQFYIGNNMDVPVSGLTGKIEGPYRGLCLETQFWPDAPNNSNFASIELLPGEKRRQVTHYSFSA